MGSRSVRIAGVVADAASIDVAIWAVVALTAVSGIIVLVRMYETHPPAGRHAAPTSPTVAATARLQAGVGRRP